LTMKRIAILQSNYIPWKGYFDLINMVDEFVIYDDAQYTKRDWRNRNLIKTVNGVRWLTIPVEVKNKYNQSIKETQVSGNRWANEHRKALKYNYSKAGCFEEIFEFLNNTYSNCERHLFLSEINRLFITAITDYLGIKTKISFSSEYKLEGDRSGKIMSICLQTGATEYLSGESAKTYLDIEAFRKEGLIVKWMSYSGYREYNQLYPPFLHEVSIVDMLFNTGHDSTKYLNSF
jgi:hypothetical protein